MRVGERGQRREGGDCLPVMKDTKSVRLERERASEGERMREMERVWEEGRETF